MAAEEGLEENQGCSKGSIVVNSGKTSSAHESANSTTSIAVSSAGENKETAEDNGAKEDKVAVEIGGNHNEDQDNVIPSEPTESPRADRGQGSTRAGTAKRKRYKEPTVLRRSLRNRRSRFDSSEIMRIENSHLDETFTNGNSDAGFKDDYFEHALELSKRETSGRGTSRNRPQLFQPPCTKYTSTSTSASTGDSQVCSLEDSNTADRAVSPSIGYKSATVDLTLDSDDECVDVTSAAFDSVSTMVNSTDATVLHGLVDKQCNAIGASLLTDPAISSEAGNSALTTNISHPCHQRNPKRGIKGSHVLLQRGDLVTTTYGLGSIQNIFSRERDSVFQFSVNFMKIDTSLPANDDLVLTIVSDVDPNVCKGDQIICDKNMGVEELHEKLNAGMFSGEIQVKHKVRYTVYEVWLQWGIASPNEATDKKGFSMVWMPKAFLQADSVELARKLPGVKYEFPVLFGAYGNRNKYIKLTGEDMARMWPGLHLNDAILDYCIGHILPQVDPIRREKLYVFHSLFFSWFMDRVDNNGGPKSPESFKAAHRDVSKTTKNIDIFSKDLLIIPINAHLHWTLAIVCNPGLLGEAMERDQTLEGTMEVDEGGIADQDLESLQSNENTLQSSTEGTQKAGVSSDQQIDTISGGNESVNQSSLRNQHVTKMDYDDEDDQSLALKQLKTPLSHHVGGEDKVEKNEETEMCSCSYDDAKVGKDEKASSDSEEFATMAKTTSSSPASALQTPSSETSSKRTRRKPVKYASSSSKRSKYMKKPEAVGRRPYVLFFDSLRGHQTARVLKLLRGYLQEEWIARRGPLPSSVNASSLPGLSPAVPLQLNQCDCGVYLLEYLERILTEKLDDLLELVSDESATTSRVRTKTNSLFGKKWFEPKDVAQKRSDFLKILRTELALATKRSPPQSDVLIS